MSDTTTSKVSEGAHTPKENDGKAAGISAESPPDAPADPSAGASPTAAQDGADTSTPDGADDDATQPTDAKLDDVVRSRNEWKAKARDALAERDSLRTRVAELEARHAAHEQLEREHSQLVETTRQRRKEDVIDAVAQTLRSTSEALCTSLVDMAAVEGVDIHAGSIDNAIDAIRAQLTDRFTAHVAKRSGVGAYLYGQPGRPRSPRTSSAI